MLVGRIMRVKEGQKEIRKEAKLQVEVLLSQYKIL